MKILKTLLNIGLMVLVIGTSLISYAHAESNPFWEKSFWRSATVTDVERALKDGYDVNQATSEGLTPIAHASMESNDPKVIQFLIDKGAEVNPEIDWGWSPLFLASMNSDNPEVIDVLIKNGADIEERCVGINSTPLIDAVVHNRNPEIVMTLLEAGANPHAKDDKGWSSIDYVKMKGNYHKNDMVYKAITSN